MTLWDIIRDWFVSHIWGGLASNGSYHSGLIGTITDGDNLGNYGEAYSDSLFIPINAYYDTDYTGTASYIAIGDWLSTTSTIIVLCAMCFFLFLVVRWLFRLTSGLLSGRG